MTLPALFSFSPHKTFKRVVFPLPFLPKRTVTEEAGREKERSLRTFFSPSLASSPSTLRQPPMPFPLLQEGREVRPKGGKRPRGKAPKESRGSKERGKGG